MRMKRMEKTEGTEFSNPIFCCRCDNCMGFSSHVVFNDIWCFWCDKDDEDGNE